MFTESIILQTDTFWNFCYLYSNPKADDGIRFAAQVRTASKIHHQKKVFLVGSSQTREDYNVEYLNSTLQHADIVFFNLGVSGAAQPIELFMIKEKLLKLKPAVIIYMPFVGSFYSDYAFHKMKYYFHPAIVPYMVQHLGIKQVIKYKSAFTDSFLGMCSGFFKYRESLRRIFEHALKHYLNIEKREVPKRYAPKENRPPSYFTEHITKADKRKYTVCPLTPVNKYLFIQCAKDIMAQGVRFIVVSGPTHPLIKECYTRGIDREYTAFLADQAHILDFTYLGEEQLPPFAAGEFIDFTHLNAPGREKFSRFITQYLREEYLAPLIHEQHRNKTHE